MTDPDRPSASTLAAVLAAIVVSMLAAGTAPPASARPAEIVPVPMPADTSPASLRASLDSQWQEALDGGEWVVTFHEQEEADDDGIRLRAVSLSVLDFSPDLVRGLLASPGDYPSWVPLNPSYKSVRISGSRRMHAEVGRSRSRRASESLVYSLEPAADGMTWRLVESRSPLRVGSQVSWRVVPHPEREGASLVVHDQLILLPERGRLSRYLTSDDDSERNRFWKDANKHARRIHFAMDATLRHPDQRERFSLYAEHYQREFGDVPYWAK